jgi:hypothetical protein
MLINKSKRHSKYIGLFGETLVCNILSRSGFEVMLVDHVGIDIIAFRPDVGRLGISVKSRMRQDETNEISSVNLFSSQDSHLAETCAGFHLTPWIAVYVETRKSADLYLTSFENYKEKYAGNEGLAMLRWDMREKNRQSYNEDEAIMYLRIEFSQNDWFE